MFSRPCPNPGLNVVERFGASQVNPREAQAAGDEVQMGVVEAREDRRAIRVDHRRLRAAEPRDLTLAADAKHLIAADGDGLRHRAASTGRIHLRVVDDDVDGPVRVVPLGPDDQAGDERRRDDSDDEIGGKAGGH